MRRLGVVGASSSSIERAALRPLPAEDYEYAEWRLARVSLDYHVEAEGFLYSVPHAGSSAQVDDAPDQPHRRGVPSRPTRRRPSAPLRRTPARHRSGSHAALAPALCRVDARALPALGSRDGPHTEGLILAVLAVPHPEQGLRTCLGVLQLCRLGHPGGSGLRPGRRDRRAHLHEHRLILAHNLDRASPQAGSAPVIDHPSVRLALLPLTEAFMLAHPTLDLLHALGLHGMAEATKGSPPTPAPRALDHAEVARPAA